MLPMPPNLRIVPRAPYNIDPSSGRGRSSRTRAPWATLLRSTRLQLRRPQFQRWQSILVDFWYVSVSYTDSNALIVSQEMDIEYYDSSSATYSPFLRTRHPPGRPPSLAYQLSSTSTTSQQMPSQYYQTARPPYFQHASPSPHPHAWAMPIRASFPSESPRLEPPPQPWALPRPSSATAAHYYWPRAPTQIPFSQASQHVPPSALPSFKQSRPYPPQPPLSSSPLVAAEASRQAATQHTASEYLHWDPLESDLSRNPHQQTYADTTAGFDAGPSAGHR